jgi:hypothetical protein
VRPCLDTEKSSGSTLVVSSAGVQPRVGLDPLPIDCTRRAVCHRSSPPREPAGGKGVCVSISRSPTHGPNLASHVYEIETAPR